MRLIAGLVCTAVLVAWGADAAGATAGPGAPIGGPGVKRKPTGSMPRVLSRDPEAFGKPTGREEEWRFTPVDRLAYDGARGRRPGARPARRCSSVGRAPHL